MESLWRAIGHWRQDGYRYQPHSCMVHVHFAAHAGFTHHHLHDPRILDEYPELYPGEKAKSHLVSLISIEDLC